MIRTGANRLRPASGTSVGPHDPDGESLDQAVGCGPIGIGQPQLHLPDGRTSRHVPGAPARGLISLSRRSVEEDGPERNAHIRPRTAPDLPRR